MKTLVSDDDAVYDKVIRMDMLRSCSDEAGDQSFYGNWTSRLLSEIRDMNDERAYHYMDLEPGQKPADIELNLYLYGSCTYNARLSDLELAARSL